MASAGSAAWRIDVPTRMTSAPAARARRASAGARIELSDSSPTPGGPPREGAPLLGRAPLAPRQDGQEPLRLPAADRPGQASGRRAVATPPGAGRLGHGAGHAGLGAGRPGHGAGPAGLGAGPPGHG